MFFPGHLTRWSDNNDRFPTTTSILKKFFQTPGWTVRAAALIWRLRAIESKRYTRLPSVTILEQFGSFLF